MHEGVEFALVINGAALHHAFTGEARRIFTELAFICHSVICCRMTPMQKAEVVEIVHDVTGEIVLAVGDGANDVAMIQVLEFLKNLRIFDSFFIINFLKFYENLR